MNKIIAHIKNESTNPFKVKLTETTSPISVTSQDVTGIHNLMHTNRNFSIGMEKPHKIPHGLFGNRIVRSYIEQINSTLVIHFIDQEIIQRFEDQKKLDNPTYDGIPPEFLQFLQGNYKPITFKQLMEKLDGPRRGGDRIERGSTETIVDNSEPVEKHWFDFPSENLWHTFPVENLWEPWHRTTSISKAIRSKNTILNGMGIETYHSTRIDKQPHLRSQTNIPDNINKARGHVSQRRGASGIMSV